MATHELQSRQLLALGRDVSFLEAVAATFLARGFDRGEGAVLLTDGPPAARILALLRSSTTGAQRTRSQRLFEVVEPGAPDLARVVADVRSRSAYTRVRVYADRANRLWLAGDLPGALAEQGAQQALLVQDDVVWLSPLQLDPCAPSLEASAAVSLCRSYGRVYAVQSDVRRRARVLGAIERVLGMHSSIRLPLLLAGSGLPPADEGAEELTMLWLRTEVPHLAQRIVAAINAPPTAPTAA